MKEVKKAHASAEAGVKNAEKQAEELRVKLREKQQAVSTLKAELARTKEEARLAREAAEKADVARNTSPRPGM